MTVDIVIKNGLVVLPSGISDCSLVIDDGKITGIVKSSEPQASRVIDASGKVVLPGMIDMHVHLRDPGFPERENFESGTRAAAAGGVTTVIDMPNTVPSVTTVDAVKEKVAIAEKKSLVDFALIGGAGEVSEEDLRGMAKEGVVAFKTFLTARFKELAASDAKMIDNFKVISELGLPCLIHAENQNIVATWIEKAIEAGRVDPIAHCEFRPAIAEEEATFRTILLARESNVHLHICHMTAAGAVDALLWAQEQGQRVTGETSVNYLLMDSTAMLKHGPYAKIDPPLRGPDDQDALWWAINNGVIDVLASDHAPYPMAEKEKGWTNIYDAPSGGVGIEYSLQLMLNCVNQNRISLERLVEVFSVNPAKINGLFPRKGSLLPGADADFILVDLDAEYTILGEKLHSKEKMTAFEGWSGNGLPITTYVRGKPIVLKREPVSKAGFGLYLRR